MFDTFAQKNQTRNAIMLGALNLIRNYQQQSDSRRLSRLNQKSSFKKKKIQYPF